MIAKDGWRRGANGQNSPTGGKTGQSLPDPCPDMANKTGDGAPLSPCAIKYRCGDGRLGKEAWRKGAAGRGEGILPTAWSHAEPGGQSPAEAWHSPADGVAGLNFWYFLDMRSGECVAFKDETSGDGPPSFITRSFRPGPGRKLLRAEEIGGGGDA